MKFGKQLILKSNKVWEYYYIDYRSLKKLLKALLCTRKNETPKNLEEAEATEFNKEFFDTLKKEIEKANKFFIKIEEQCILDFKRFRHEVLTTKERDFIPLSEKIASLIDFSMLNSTAIEKILKKHDKMFKCNLKEEFIEKYTSTLEMKNSKILDDLNIKIHELLSASPIEQEVKEATVFSPEPKTVDELDLDSLEMGRVHHLWVNLMTNALGLYIKVPLIVARGKYQGPVLGISAALHGNEINGIPIIHKLYDELDVQTLCGTIVSVVITNPIGYMRQTRGFSDFPDLNRVFPGRENGNTAEAYVHKLLTKIFSKFEYHIDLHTAAFGRTNPLYVRANLSDPMTRRMALLLNPQIILQHRSIAGSLRQTAMQMGIKSITVEIGSPYSFHKRYIKFALSGISQIMSYLKMIPEKEEAITILETIICTKSYWLYTDVGGVLEVFPSPNTWVRKGEKVAQVTTLLGDLKKVYYAPEEGIVIGKTTNPVAEAGTRILHLGIVSLKM